MEPLANVLLSSFLTILGLCGQSLNYENYVPFLFQDCFQVKLVDASTMEGLIEGYGGRHNMLELSCYADGTTHGVNGFRGGKPYMHRVFIDWEPEDCPCIIGLRLKDQSATSVGMVLGVLGELSLANFGARKCLVMIHVRAVDPFPESWPKSWKDTPRKKAFTPVVELSECVMR